MLEGWLALGLEPRKVAVLEPQPSQRDHGAGARAACASIRAGAVGEVAAVVLAVKPQVAAEVMPTLAPLVGAATVVVSIMAGRTLALPRAARCRDAAIVRAMPNTPAAIGRGITVAVPNARVTRGAARARARAARAPPARSNGSTTRR